MDLLRQLAILSEPEKLETPVTIIGAGGIGAPVTLLLAKMGMTNIEVWDDDVVEVHNLPNTLLPAEVWDEKLDRVDLTTGMPKVNALYELAWSMARVEIIDRVGRWPQDQTTDDFDLIVEAGLPEIMISAVDTMQARHDIWDFIMDDPGDYPALYIDCRMGGEFGELYAVVDKRPEYIKAYESHLLNEEDVPEAPCTARAIIYNAMMLASVVAAMVKKYLVGTEEIPWQVLMDTRNLGLFPQYLGRTG